MKVLPILLLLLASASNYPEIPEPKLSVPQECASLTFQGITSDAWNCARGKFAEKSFTISEGNSGQISRDDNAGVFIFDPAKRTLVITIKQHSVGCAVIAKAITETVDACRDFEEIRLLRRTDEEEEWRIDAPNVKQQETVYKQIIFRPGDTVTVKAGGCVQHGGFGQTWKLYVDPQKRRPDSFFYGQLKLPGMNSLMTIKEFMSSNQGYTVSSSATGDMRLHLGYTDFDYNQNGYWGHEGDDGYNDQCKEIGNAWVEIKITRQHR